MVINGFFEAFLIDVLIPLLSIVFGNDNNNLFANTNKNMLKYFNINTDLGFFISFIVLVYFKTL